MALTSLIFLLAFVTCLGLCVFRHPVYGLYAYLAVFYLDAPSRWWGVYLPELRWSLIAGVVTLASTVFFGPRGNRPSWLHHQPVRLFIAFVVLLILLTPWALNESEHAFAVSLFPKYIIALYFFYALADSLDRVRNILLAHALGCFYLGLLAFTSYSGGRLDGIGGPGISDSNSLGVQLSTGVFAAAAVYLSGKGWKKWVAAASVPFLLNTIVMTGARGAFLALVAGGAAFFLFRPAKQLKVVVVYAIVGVFGFLYVANDIFWDRMGTLRDASTMIEVEEEGDGSIDARIAVLEAQWRMFLDRPMGGGHRTTTAQSYTYIDERYHSGEGGRSSHNTVMSALVDQGFIGLVIWLWLLWAIVVRLYRIRAFARSTDDTELAWINAAIAASIAVITVAGMFYPLLRLEAYVWMMSLTCALAALVPATQPAGNEKFTLRARPARS